MEALPCPIRVCRRTIHHAGAADGAPARHRLDEHRIRTQLPAEEEERASQVLVKDSRRHDVTRRPGQQRPGARGQAHVGLAAAEDGDGGGGGNRSLTDTGRWRGNLEMGGGTRRGAGTYRRRQEPLLAPTGGRRRQEAGCRATRGIEVVGNGIRGVRAWAKVGFFCNETNRL